MRWLTREWQAGALPQAERESRWQIYLEHRDTTAIHLPPALHRLAAVNVDGALTLHQAVPDWWTYEPGKAFTLSVITGDPGLDPQRIVLQYLGHLEVTGAEPADIDRWLSRPDARLLYDEIEVLPGRRFEQRFLLAPDGELTVRFDSVLLVSAPATAAERASLLERKGGGSRNGGAPEAPSTPVTEPVTASAPLATSEAVATPEAAAAAEPVTAPASSPPQSAAESTPDDLPEGSPAPLPATTEPTPARKRSLREALLSWLPGVRGPHD